MYRIYDIDNEGNEYCVTGLISSYKDAKTLLVLMHKHKPNAYIKASDE